ncbi:MAG: ABC transporter ATP-binding protein [Gemmataceae bacterium]|jgi:ABC-2 type transport system ATP-binding protein|nr:ABC transporter ATP-binding protein [Gemmataceae bacterium]
MNPILQVRNLTKTYGTREAVRGVTFSIERGDFFGLLGPNGAGKSTLARILSGIDEPTQGEIFLQGEPFDPRSPEHKKKIGLAPQDLALYEDLSAAENLSFFGQLYGLKGSHLKHRIQAMLDLAELNGRAKDKVAHFSGGMKRRLNLAVAVIHEPELLFLDEPTTGVDPQSRNHIFEQVNALRDSGMTIVYTSHYMEEIETLCQTVAIIDRGEIIARDSLQGLLALHKTRVTVTLKQNVSPSLLQQIAQTTGAIHEGATLIFEGNSPSELVQKIWHILQQHSLEPESLQIDSPTLEKVFLELTQKKLRD